jgi:hypothetical protein
VRLIVGEESGRYGVGTEHLYHCLRRLALAAPGAPTDPARAAADEASPQAPAGDSNYVILLTTAAPGSIPGNIWRTSHVIYL